MKDNKAEEKKEEKNPESNENKENTGENNNQEGQKNEENQNLILPKRGNSIDKVTQSPKTNEINGILSGGISIEGVNDLTKEQIEFFKNQEKELQKENKSK